jgi:hypothetical protein
MKSLAIIGLALLGGSAASTGIYSDNEFRVQGNHNTGIMSMNDKNAHLGNNQGIINVFGKDGKKNAPNNNGFINVLPFHIVRDDEVDNELGVSGNFNTGIMNMNDRNARLGNNQGIINVFGNDGKKSAPNNNGFINVLPFHIVRDDEADNELADHLTIHNRRGGQVTINNHSHDDELFDGDNELADSRISMPNNRGFITVNQWDDELDNELAISINMSGNSGKVNINSNNPENLKGLVIENNRGVVTTNNAENLKNMVIKNNHGKIGVANPEEEPIEIPDISADMNSLRKAMNDMKVAHNKAFLGKH